MLGVSSEIDDSVLRFIENCPDQLCEKKMWLMWRLSVNPKTGKQRKIPFYIDGTPRRTHGSLEDITKLASFDDVIKVFSQGDFTGIGFATLPQFGIVVCDLDDKAGGGLHPDAERIAKMSYAEKSYSGRGLHVIWEGEMESCKANSIGVEIFSNSGFLVFTGQRYNSRPVVKLQSEVREHLVKLVTGNMPQQLLEPSNNEEGVVSTKLINELRSALCVLDPDDYDSWIRQGQRLFQLGAVGKDLWLEWSERSEKFDEQEAETKWATFTGDKTGYLGVFKEARNLGWLMRQQDVANVFQPISEDSDFFISIGKLLTHKDPPEWLIHGLIQTNSLCLLYGAPSVGKSFFAIDWALSVATGRPWQGRKVKQGTVCYLAGEGFAGFKRRSAAWSLDREVDVSNSALLFNQKTVQLIDEESCFEAHKAVAEVIREYGPLQLLCLDTFNRTAGGDENSNSDTSDILRNLEKYFLRPFNCTVLIVHHVGHNDGQRSRGASALPAGVDSAFLMVERDGLRTLTPTKQKESELGEPMVFQLSTVELLDWPMDPDTGEKQVSAVLHPVEGVRDSPSLKKLTQRQFQALTSLDTAISEHGVLPPKEVSTKTLSRVVHENHWREVFYCSPVLDADMKLEAKRKAFNRAKADLLKLKRIEGGHGFIWKM